MPPTIILASASPQRSRLLAGIDMPFVVEPSDFDEQLCPERDPKARAISLAASKARAVAVHHNGAWVLGCDTLVVAPDGTILEKPVTAEDARTMIKKQSGGTSVVHSAIHLIHPKGEASDIDSTAVTFATLTDRDVDWWMATNLWRDRSGSFQIDGPGQLMIERIEGDWTGVVGLPIFKLGKLLCEAGFLDA